jgi:hypothetical protein
MATHESCNSTLFEALPSRVIDVGVSGGDELRLVDSSGIEGLDLVNGYATLSHCWGNVERTTTTSGNLESMQRGFDVAVLSPTFRDAVLVSRGLEIRYLW